MIKLIRSAIHRYRLSLRRLIDREENPMEQKRIFIVFNLAGIQILTNIALFLYVIFNETDYPFPFFAVAIIAVTVVLIYIALKGKYKLAVTLGLLFMNIILFFLSERMGNSAGVQIYYASTIVAALVLNGFEEWQKGVGMALLSVFLFVISRLFTISFIPVLPLTTTQATQLYVINLLVTFGLSAYCIYLMMKLNYESEKTLLDQQRVIKNQNEELKKTNLELDRFVYSASHDLSAPLRSIQGLISLAKTEKPPESIDNLLSLMKRSVSKLDAFISDIILFSRNARSEVKKEAIDLDNLVDSVWADHQYDPKCANIQFQKMSEVQFINSDETRLNIILNNLISNAIKFHLPSQRQTPYIKVTSKAVPGYVVLEVEDNGMGIDPKYQESIFKMFFRGNDFIEGSGLGLYILNETVARLNGRVLVESTLGIGTKFIVTLPT